MARPLAVLAVAGGTLVLAGAGATASWPTFRMPSKNIACLESPGYLRCDVLSGLRPEPRLSCFLDWTGLSMRVTGRARPTCAGDTVFDTHAPILRYGRTWRRGGFTCVSRTTGLRCTNRSRHGFFLSRERWRVF